MVPFGTLWTSPNGFLHTHSAGQADVTYFCHQRDYGFHLSVCLVGYRRMLGMTDQSWWCSIPYLWGVNTRPSAASVLDSMEYCVWRRSWQENRTPTQQALEDCRKWEWTHPRHCINTTLGSLEWIHLCCTLRNPFSPIPTSAIKLKELDTMNLHDLFCYDPTLLRGTIEFLLFNLFRRRYHFEHPLKS